jgi:hypothetical protein
MPTEEFLRATRVANRKKKRRLDSIEGHIEEIIAHKATKTSLEADVAAFNTSIAGIVSQPKQDEINALATVIRMQAIYASDIAAVDARIARKRTAIDNINTLVQADADYTAAEKTEFQNMKDNEV